MNSHLQAKKRKGITLWPLIAATYFMVSGGPYGLEEVVKGAGYGGAILLLLVTPLIWSLPTALMIGELSSAIPAEGGYYVWVERALGPFWGFQEAWLSLAASVFDMAIYPTIFTLYLGRFWPPAEAHPVLIGGAVITACVLWNLLGTRAVGDGSVLMMLALLAPFAVLTAVALFRSPAHLTPAAAVPGAEHIGLLGAALIAVWNYMG